MSRDDQVLYIRNDVQPGDRLRRELNGIQRSLDRVEVQLLDVKRLLEGYYEAEIAKQVKRDEKTD
jgi:hypothetical protein